MLEFFTSGAPLQAIFIFGLVGLAVLFSSYVKIATVLNILRIGFGFDSIPGAFITFGLALSLSFFVMQPVLLSIDASLETSTEKAEENAPSLSKPKLNLVLSRWKKFVFKHTDAEYLNRFTELAVEIDGEAATEQKVVDEKGWRVLAPAFVVTELSEAFSIGLLLLLPFLIIDIVSSVILSAVGLERFSPVTLALPLKLLLFVGVDAWSLIAGNLVATYG